MNPYKPDDKIITKVKGTDVEATVRLVWSEEVQVRTLDGLLRWRTAKTVRPAVAREEAPADPAPTAPLPTVAPATPEPPAPTVEPAAVEATQPTPSETAEAAAPAVEPAPAAPAPEVTEQPSKSPKGRKLITASPMQGGCGTAEDIVNQRRNRRR